MGGGISDSLQRTAPIGLLLDASLHQAVAARCFGRGKQSLEDQMREGLAQMAEICDGLK